MVPLIYLRNEGWKVGAEAIYFREQEGENREVIQDKTTSAYEY